MDRFSRYLQFAMISLAIAATITLAIFLWPITLFSTIINFSVFGLSIFGLVGSNVILQIAALTTVIFAGLHAVALAVEALGSLVAGLFDLFKANSPVPQPQEKTQKGLDDSEYVLVDDISIASSVEENKKSLSVSSSRTLVPENNKGSLSASSSMTLFAKNTPHNNPSTTKNAEEDGMNRSRSSTM